MAGASGTVIISEPSFGVLAASTVSKFNPPSVDNSMFTFEVLIPFAVVPATSHVIVSFDPLNQVLPS